MSRKLKYTRRDLRRLIRRAEGERPGTQCYREAWDEAREAARVYIDETGKFPPKGL